MDLTRVPMNVNKRFPRDQAGDGINGELTVVYELPGDLVGCDNKLWYSSLF